MKGIKIFLLLISVILISCNSFNNPEDLFQNLKMLEDAKDNLPRLTEEEKLIAKSFLAEESSVTPVSPVSPVEPSVPVPSPSQPKPPTTWDNLVTLFDHLTNNWKRLIDTFKTTRSSEIKERLLGKGFEYFSQSAQLQITKKVKGQFIDQYFKHLATRIKVPAERQGDLAMVLEESKWTESNVWTGFDTVFSIDKGGNTKFASILIARDDTADTYDFIFTDVKADFKLAPDTLVIHKKLSVLGGIWEDEKDEMVKVPKNVTPEDVSTVIQFFQIVAYKGFAEYFGVKLEFPKVK
jgi:hypothetical protein